jgi:hypothetical protein
MEKYSLKYGKVLLKIWKSTTQNMEKYSLKYGKVLLKIWKSVL